MRTAYGVRLHDFWVCLKAWAVTKSKAQAVVECPLMALSRSVHRLLAVSRRLLVAEIVQGLRHGLYGLVSPRK